MRIFLLNVLASIVAVIICGLARLLAGFIKSRSRLYEKLSGSLLTSVVGTWFQKQSLAFLLKENARFVRRGPGVFGLAMLVIAFGLMSIFAPFTTNRDSEIIPVTKRNESVSKSESNLHNHLAKQANRGRQISTVDKALLEITKTFDSNPCIEFFKPKLRAGDTPVPTSILNKEILDRCGRAIRSSASPL